ncbi:hypothetical protein E2C01_048023 [Portunus trituberculatus]|uniref:Uncharacterized protein n=1 Tax=Portunus trituberculatus TaxID=210409 RepID=A0A5B7G9F6_PORTR|nr:hypothetical protein [Portunus trituberculatus]
MFLCQGHIGSLWPRVSVSKQPVVGGGGGQKGILVAVCGREAVPAHQRPTVRLGLELLTAAHCPLPTTPVCLCVRVSPAILP